MHLLCIYVFTLYLYKKKYLHVITSVIHFCNDIYNYTVDLKPTHTTKPVPNLTHIPPQ